jgi:hypothetical protein
MAGKCTVCAESGLTTNAKLNALLSLLGAFLGRDLTFPTLENVIVNVVPLQKTHRSGSRFRFPRPPLATVAPFSLVHDNEADAQWSADNPVSVGRQQCTAFA